MSGKFGAWGFCDFCEQDSWVVPFGPYDDLIDPDGYICGGGCDDDDDEEDER